MQNATLWRALLGVEKTVVEDIEFDEDEQVLVAHVRARARARARPQCGRCERRAPVYDRGEGRRRWRALDLGGPGRVGGRRTPGELRRARPDGGRGAVGSSRRRPHQGLRRAGRLAGDPDLEDGGDRADADRLVDHGRAVGAVITRVWADVESLHDRFANLTRIGIDEISYKRGHRYLTVVVDHDTGRLVWAAPGRDKATLGVFFDALEASGPRRCVQITHVSADGADWISDVVEQRCPNAVRCADPFHIVKWAGEALDEVRRQAWNEARGAVRQRRAGRASGHAKALKHARFALWKNPENLTSRQQAKLEWIAKTDPRLHRAYLLKEGLRLVFQLPYDEAVDALETWIGWARRCRIGAFVDLQRRIVKHRASILAAIEHGLSNGRIESVNTKIRLITRVAFGFRSPDALIALAMLNLGGHRPTLPGRK